MVWKKVSNSDAGDSTHFGGDDVDKISLTFNAETQTDPINIKDENLLIVDPADTAKKVRFDAGGITSSTTRVMTIPDADITLASTVTATTSVAGLMSTTDKTKLDAIEASATADQTGGQIKTLYEAEANAFTDTQFTKLAGIEASATADQTDAEIRTAVDSATDSNVFTDADVTTLGNRAPLDSPALTGTATAVNLTLSGDLTVNGTNTIINSTTLTVDDKNIEMGSVASPTDITADGGGITLKGATDKTILWDNANDNFTSNQDWNIPTGKVFKINNVSTLSATALGSAVVSSSLTSVGTLASPVLTTPNIGTPSAGVLTSCTGLPATTGLTATGNKHATTFLRGDDTWAVVDASPLTTEGDVYIYTGSANARLPRGTSAQVLSVNAGGTAIEWADPAGGGSTITHAFVNSTTTTYVGTGTAGTGIDVGVAVATEASGVGEREIYIKKIDANNEGVFTVIHKNGAAVEVQIA